MLPVDDHHPQYLPDLFPDRWPDLLPALPHASVQPRDLPATLVDLLQGVAEIVRALVDAVKRMVEPVAAAAATAATQLGRRIERSPALDAVADAFDRALVWAGSPDGRAMLEGIDTAMLGQRTAEFYGRVGVYRPFAPRLVRDAIERSECFGPHDLRAILADVGPDSEHWRWLTDGLLESPSMRDRRDLIADGIACIEAGLHGPAVSTLLPVFEGVVGDKSGVLQHQRVGLRLGMLLDGEAPAGPNLFGDLVVRPALRIVDDEVFARREFESVPIDSAMFNRHVILHGRTTGFRTAEHALQSLMLLVALAELLDGPIFLRTTGPLPMGDPNLLDDFGALYPLRNAGAARAAIDEPVWRADRVRARREARALARAAT